MPGEEFVQEGLFQRFFMVKYIGRIRLVGLWAILLLLAGSGTTWAQSIKISGKTCVPDLECKSDSVVLTDSVQTGVTTRVWSFGDGSTVTTKSDSVAKHVYQRPGTFTVTLTRTFNGVTQTASRGVTIYNRPQQFTKWRTDTTICKGEKITLDPYNGSQQTQYNYLWYPKGDTTQAIRVDSSGCYSVEAIDPISGCSYQNRINVDVCGEKKESQGVKWYFGANAGLDFSGGGSPKPITDGTLSTIEGSSSIANTKGVLLFYTDGITIYGKDGKPLKSLVPGDTNAVQIPLGGNTHSTQSALIVPKPTCRGCEYLYYVYTTSEIRGKKVLTYSVVDMRENGGKGAVVEKNIPVSSQGTEQSASVRNDRDSTYWVITRKYGTNTFEIRHLTTAESPVTTTYSGGQKIDSLANAEGYIKIGPADTTGGNKGNRPMAVVVPGPPKNSVDLYTFNDSTGKLTYQRTLNLGPAPPKAYGVEFSPDGKSLYVTMLADTNSDGSQKGASYILKYDISQKDSSLLVGSRTVVDSSTTRQYGSVQIGPDGKIYVAIKGSSTLGTINNPNGGLLDSLVYNPAGQSLGGKTSQLGLPNLVANFNDQSSGPGLMYSDTCAKQPTTFQISPNCPKLKEQYTLDYGDGSRPYSTTATQPIKHTYSTPGRYFVSLHIVTKNSTGGICKDTLIKDTLNIIETPPDIKFGADTAICNKKGIILDLKVQAKIYVWVVNGRVVSRQKTIKIALPGFYHVIGFAANGECFKSDTIDVQIKPPPSLDLGPDTVFCYRTTVNLTVPQQTWTQFQWSNGGNTRTISVTKAGTYTVTAQSTVNGTTCENSDTISVRELPKIKLVAALTAPKACTSADGAIALTPTPAGNYRYNWIRSDGAVLPDTVSQQTGLTEGSYKITVTELVHACKADTAFTLKSSANQLTLVPFVKDALCSMPNSGTISLSISGGTAVSYAWLDQNNNILANTPVYDKAAPGRYNVQVTDANGCKANKDSIRVGLDSTGFARLGPNQLKCVGEKVILTPDDGSLPGNTYQWSTGASSRTITVSQAGSYSLVVRNTQTGCVGRSSTQVSDRPAPAFSLTKEAVICEGDQGKVQLVANGAAGLHYRWLPPQTDTTKTITVSRVGQYQVLVTDPQGCTATGTALVVNKCEPRLNVPDAFTPNGDGLNDQLQVFSAYVTEYEFRIYNRWGEVIFVSNNPEQKWDGTYRGSTYPSMLYPYIVTYKSESFPERERVIKRGSVLLLR